MLFSKKQIPSLSSPREIPEIPNEQRVASLTQTRSLSSSVDLRLPLVVAERNLSIKVAGLFSMLETTDPGEKAPGSLTRN